MTARNLPRWILSGSHLITGQPLYLSINTQHPQHQWSGALREATPLRDEEREPWMRQAQLDMSANHVVDPYLIALSPDSAPHHPQLIRRREQIRVSGPSVRPDLTPYAPPSSSESIESSIESSKEHTHVSI